MICVTRKSTYKPDILRNYRSSDATQENYNCQIWEAASATAAAPMYFKHVKFEKTGEKWCDGGIHRNNPINEALAEIRREKDWKTAQKKVGCVVSLGTGVAEIEGVSSNLIGFMKGAIDIMTDSEEIANDFEASELGTSLAGSHRYFRFNVPQGLQDLNLDECKEVERMSALTTEYLRKAGSGTMVERCVKSLLYPDQNCESGH